MRAIELFAGGGGLLLGTSLAGFSHELAVEWDHRACETLRHNALNAYPLVSNLKVHEGDVRRIDWARIGGDVDLLSGGPPCQPFSLGGLARSADDPRDMFPAFTSALLDIRPRAFLIENVRGLTRSSFADYYSYILLRLQHPCVRSSEDETWRNHLTRLEREHTAGQSDDLTYRVIPTMVDAADYGVAQHRHRVFIVGFRSDISADWSFPAPTHSGSALLREQRSGAYWDRHEIAQGERLVPRGNAGGDPTLLPWRTLRDAIGHMPPPQPRGTDGWLNHELIKGARSYPGHTGSCLDEPSKALKAGVHGVPGGENMIRFHDGSLRYFSVREAARIQGFPNRYEFVGSWGESMRQIGNAVPVQLARAVASSIAVALSRDSARTVIDKEMALWEKEVTAGAPA